MEEIKQEPVKVIEMEIQTRTFECETCHLIFKSAFNLKRHFQRAHGDAKRLYLNHIKKDKRYVCSVCQKEYTHTANLKVHYAKHHTK